MTATIKDKVTNAWCRWLRQAIHDDHYGHWVAFTLTTRYRLSVLAERFTDRCQSVDGWTLEHSDLRRRRSGLCAYILPAIAASNHAHFHGMVRLPRSECPPDDEWVPITIQEASSWLSIRVPPILRTLLWKKPDSPQSTFGNIHLRHADGMVELLTPKSGQSVLSYWNQHRDGEHRDFDAAVFAPWGMRGVLKIRRGREPISATRRRLRSRAAPGARQTVAEFLSAGGTITVVPPKTDGRRQ
jgi:hypothetical protein